MKIPAEQLKAAMRRRREEAGENVRLAKRARGRSRAKPSRAPEVAMDIPLAAAAAAVAEGSGGYGWAEVIAELPTAAAAVGPSRMAPEEAPGVKIAPGPAEGVIEERELQVPPAEAEEEIPAAAEPVVVVLDPEDGVPADAEPAEVGQAGEEGGLPAPPESEAEKVPSAAEEGEIAADVAESRTPGAGEAEAGKAGAGEAGVETPPPRIKHHMAQRVEDADSAPGAEVLHDGGWGEGGMPSEGTAAARDPHRTGATVPRRTS